VSDTERVPSAREQELLERAFQYILDHGLADVSLRPLAAAIGSSPRVLLFLYGSKDGLVQALLARARVDELRLLDQVPRGDLAGVVNAVWGWLADPAHRPLLVLWSEAYARSLVEPDGPWAGFARQTVEDWLAVIADADTRGAAGVDHTLVLSVLRGALLDLLATGEVERTGAAVDQMLNLIEPKPVSRSGVQTRKGSRTRSSRMEGSDDNP
jgi:AcrR family transcriptional regulator